MSSQDYLIICTILSIPKLYLEWFLFFPKLHPVLVFLTQCLVLLASLFSFFLSQIHYKSVESWLVLLILLIFVSCFHLYHTNSFNLPTFFISISFANFLPSNFTLCSRCTIKISSTQVSHIANLLVSFLEKYMHGSTLNCFHSMFFIIFNIFV